MSSQLLCKLEHTKEDPFWNDHSDLLLWLLCIGGAFAPPGPVRSGYVVLLRSSNTAGFSNMYESWEELLEILKQFTWSEKAFRLPVKALWDEISGCNV